MTIFVLTKDFSSEKTNMITAYKACSSQLRVNIEKNPQNRCQVLLEDFRKAIAEKI